MCKTKPVHSDGSKTFAFCGKACATKACKVCSHLITFSIQPPGLISNDPIVL